MTDDPLVRLIARRYAQAPKIVEVGVGRRPGTAAALAEALPGTTVVATDVDGGALAAGAAGRARLERDDVLEPRREIYHGASLLYGVRIPAELFPALAALADDVGADALLAPLCDEAGALDAPPWRPVAAGGRVVAWWRPRGAAVPTQAP